MNPDRKLSDAIKEHFARKSLAQLEEIVRDTPQGHWSPEAITAAGEVLQDRLAGRADEPLVGEEEPPLPPLRSESYSLSYLALGILGGLTGAMIIPIPGRIDYTSAPPDPPIPFGPNKAWLAIDSIDTDEVASALELREARPATWAQGLPAANQSSIFVTPPLGDWTLATGLALFPTDRVEAFVKPLLERLSRQFGEAQYFGTHRAGELHIWARARRGRLVRGYGWLGDKGLTLWNEGAPTKEEQSLGLVFLDGLSRDGARPDENTVMQIADLWSIDPTSLNDEYEELKTGLMGSVAPTTNPAETSS
jgi:hypothetical protein